MSKLKKGIYKYYMIFLCIIGIIGSGLFLLIGYWSAGAMDSDSAKGFFREFGNVLKKPFANHYNTYTPIVMGIFFIAFEIIYFLVLFILIPALKQSKNNDAEEEIEEVSVPIKDDTIMDETVEISEDSKISFAKETNCFDELLFRELFSLGYTFEQITEMSKLRNYMENVSVDMLVKIFDVTMPAADICMYIKSFYD